MAMGHVILKEFHVDRQAKYFHDYVRQYTDMPMLVRLVKQGDHYVPERFLRASDFVKGMGEANNPEWKTVAYDETTGEIVVPQGSVGFRWGEKGKWNLEEKASGDQDTKLRLSLSEIKDGISPVGFPYFGNREHDHFLRHRSSRRAHAQRAGQDAAAGRRRDGRRLGLRSVRRQLRRRPRASAARTSARATTTSSPIRRPGRKRSAACRATRSSRWRANSRATPRRPTAARW